MDRQGPPSEPHARLMLFSEAVGSKFKIIEFTAVRLTTTPLWKIPLGGKSPTSQAVLYWLRARVPGKGKDSRDFKKEKKNSETFHLVFKTIQLPIFLPERGRRKRLNQV